MRRLPLVLFFAAVAAGFAGPLLYFRADSPTRSEARAGRRGAQADEPVPVRAAPIVRRDVPVYRDGIGHVQAYASILVRAQVDGRLIAVEFKEGQEVRKGDVLARIDPALYQAQYDQARAKKAQDEANLANARIDQERYERLASTNAGSKQQAEGQKALVAQLEALVRADQASIDNAKVFLDHTTIRAPIDGRLGLRQVDAGNIVRASDAAGIVGIAQMKPIVALLTLPQRDFVVVRDAMAQGAVSIDTLDADGRSALGSGTLEVIDNQIDAATGVFKVKAVFPNDDLRLWPGQFVSARARVATLKEALVIPTPAVRRGPSGTFVYALVDGKAVVRPVRIAQQDEDAAVVADGLEDGDWVITTSFARLADGKPVALSGAEPERARPGAEPPQAGAGGPRRRGSSERPAAGGRRS